MLEYVPIKVSCGVQPHSVNGLISLIEKGEWSDSQQSPLSQWSYWGSCLDTFSALFVVLGALVQPERLD